MEGIFENNELSIDVMKVNHINSYEPMFHHHMEIIYVISGSINVSIDSITHTLLPGEASITFPHIVHSYEASTDVEAYIIMFDPSIIDLYQTKLFSYKPINPYIKDGTPFLPLIEKILEYSSMNNIDYAKLANVYLLALVGEFLMALEIVKIKGTAFNTVRQILIYCAEHYTEDITAKTVSQSLYISQSTITKTFATLLGYSFREYINRLRIKKAKYYLEKTNCKIVDIMHECGFKNQSSFNRVFLEINGLTPSEYRKNVNNRLFTSLMKKW